MVVVGRRGWGWGLCLDSEHLVLVTVDPVDSLSLLAGVGGRGGGVVGECYN